MSVNDDIYGKLGELGFVGALNDRMYAELRDSGYVGSLSDMLAAAGGFKAYYEDLLSTPNERYVLDFSNDTSAKMIFPSYPIPGLGHTVEFEINPVNYSAFGYILTSTSQASTVVIQSNETIKLTLEINGGGTGTITSNAALPVGVWTKVTIKIMGPTATVEFDGVEVASGVNGAGFATADWSNLGLDDPLSILGKVKNLKLDNSRFYAIDDGWANNPVCADSISGQDGTYYNVTEPAWVTEPL